MGWLALLYGGCCYGLFLVVFLVLVVFVGDLGGARSVSSGPAVCWAEALARDLTVLLVFGLQHSLMARQAFKRAWTRRVSPALERSTYVLVSCLALALLFWAWRPLPARIWEVTAPVARGGLWVMFGAGWILALASTFQLNHGALFGLSQVWHHFRGRPNPEVAFQTPGLYRLVRHPLMLGFLVAFWATPSMDAGHLLFATVMTLYILVGTHFEERDLKRSLGPAYEAYRHRVPGLLPLPRPRRP